MSFEVEVEINGDGIKVLQKRIISLAMLCVRGIERNGFCSTDGIRRIAINETRNGIWWGISKLIFKEEEREIKTVDVRVIAEPHSEGDICKRALSESVTGGLIDFLTTHGTVLEYYEDGKVKCHLVTDVDEIPDKVTKNRRDYKKELEERIPL
jgi:hypothetical protein